MNTWQTIGLYFVIAVAAAVVIFIGAAIASWKYLRWTQRRNARKAAAEVRQLEQQYQLDQHKGDRP